MGLAAIIAGSLAYVDTKNSSASLSHALAMQKEQNAQQLRLAELDRLTVVTKSGAMVAPAAARAIERGIEADTRKLRSSANFDEGGPYYQFVTAAEHARPALLELARHSTIDINGLTINAQVAKAAAKAMRRAPDHGWDAVVRPTKATDS
jgi:hypothetical protein